MRIDALPVLSRTAPELVCTSTRPDLVRASMDDLLRGDAPAHRRDSHVAKVP
jgi:hypothetical protein